MLVVLQIQGKDRLAVAEAGKQLGLDGTYIARSYIEQVNHSMHSMRTLTCIGLFALQHFLLQMAPSVKAMARPLRLHCLPAMLLWLAVHQTHVQRTADVSMPC